jgi:hypothetical protein
MSHFTRIRTELRDIETVGRALEDMGYQVEEGQVRGFMHQRAQADIVVRMDGGYDIGFQQTGDAVTLVADFWGLRIDREAFLEQVTQRYAYVTVLDQAQEQGFQVVTQETQQDGSLRLVVQRWA